jgi:signal transduction histidine kinase
LIKTGLIHKFAQHIEWPQEEEIDTFRIGIYGEDPGLMSNIYLLESFILKGKPVSIKKFAQLDEISGIHLLYSTRDKNTEIQKIKDRIDGNHILMVSDRARNQNLTMINFLQLVDGKPDFEINKENITKAGLNITPDLLLLGGTEIDVAGIFKQSQRALQRFKNQVDDLSESFNKKSKQIESLNQEILDRNQEIEDQRRELEVQRELYEEQVSKHKLLQEEMNAHEEQLANVLEEVEVKQQTLDSKIELIKSQEDEINIQRAEIENRNSILKEQEDEIKKQEKKIEDQLSQLSNFANRVARQKTFLYIILVVCFLIVCLVFVIYRSYKVKKNANQEIEVKNRELQQSHEEIQHANEEVIATNEALEEQKQELELTLRNLKTTQSQLIDSEKMASVGVLTAGIAHELNNPINFVSGNVNPLHRDIKEIFALLHKYDDLIKAKGFNKEFGEIEEMKARMDYNFLIKEITKLLEGIKEGANRSSLIVKGLRSFSRLDEEKFQFYDIHEGIESSLILLHNKMKNRISVHKQYGDFKELECLPSKLNQVVMNILTNSIQAIEGEGDIFVQTTSSDTGIRIIIKDNGKGMSPEVKKHIFEPFYTTKDVGKGTGLGLSISFGIIEQHHGHIDVISEPGKGSEFIISLPKTQSE